MVWKAARPLATWSTSDHTISPSADTWLAWPRWALLASFAHGPLNWFNVYHRFKVRFNTLKRSEVSFWTVRRLVQISCSFLEVLCILILLAIRHNIKSEVSWVQMGEFGLVGKALSDLVISCEVSMSTMWSHRPQVHHHIVGFQIAIAAYVEISNAGLDMSFAKSAGWSVFLVVGLRESQILSRPTVSVGQIFRTYKIHVHTYVYTKQYMPLWFYSNKRITGDKVLVQNLMFSAERLIFNTCSEPRLARFLTDHENHRTQSEYETGFLVKAPHCTSSIVAETVFWATTLDIFTLRSTSKMTIYVYTCIYIYIYIVIYTLCFYRQPEWLTV